MNSDLKDLITLFNQYGIKYFVLGGYAVSYYGDPRYTKDLDVAVASSPADIDLLRKALDEFGFPITEDSGREFEEFNRMITFGIPPNRIDILNAIKGVSFEEAFSRRNLIKIGDLDVQLISFEDLVATKRATGRPQDLIDVEHLLKRNSASN
ncbi:MAG: nucleotidyl transferase AbiEii/AbiGii toxin family protein [Armatimonadota bacterium]